MTEQEELELLKENSPMTLPDDPSSSGWSAEQIKKKFYSGLFVLYDFFKASRLAQNNNIQSIEELVNEINELCSPLANNEVKAKYDINNNEIVTTYAKLVDIASGAVSAVKYLAQDGTTKKYIYELENALTTLTTNFNLLKEWADNIKSTTSEEAVQRAVRAEKDSLGNIIKDTYAVKTTFQTLINNIINGTTIVDKAYKDQNGNVIDSHYASKDFVNSSVATSTATYRGSYNLVSDLSLTVSATQSNVATALGTTIATADNNDYCYVRIPNATDTPTQIAQVDRYKYNGTTWGYEYTLNNSGYTAEQWASINSGITALLVEAIGLNTNARHSHSNKELLDTYTQTEANLSDAVIKKHSHSNKTLLDSITSNDVTKYVEVTYAQLKTLRDNSQLCKGMQYRITDYVTTTVQEGTRSAGHQFDIIVVADDVNKLNENARAVLHSGDTYFANSKLEAWEIKYCLDNDSNRFVWTSPIFALIFTDITYIRYPQADDEEKGFAWVFNLSGDNISSLEELINIQENIDEEDLIYTDTLTPSLHSTLTDSSNAEYELTEVIQGRGVIYYMKDEYNNECPYDFKNIQFKRYKITNTYYGTTNELIGRYSHDSYTIFGQKKLQVDKTTTYWCYTFSMINNFEEVVDDVSVVMNKYISDTSVYYGATKNSILPFYDDTRQNDIMRYKLNDIVFVTDTCLRGIEEDYSYGEFMGYQNNLIDSQCEQITISDVCDNVIKDSYNIIIFGDRNEIINSSNTIIAFCIRNKVNGYSNVIEADSNKVKGDYNIVTGAICEIHGDHNTIKGDDIIIEDGDYIRIGEKCTNIKIGENCHSIYFGDSVTLDNNIYFDNIVIDDNCSFVRINSNQSTSSSNKIQNIHVHTMQGSSNFNLKQISAPVGATYTTDYYAQGHQEVEI